MRFLIAALLVVTPALAAAQESTLPRIGLPLAPIGLPLAPIGLGPAAPTPTLSPLPAPAAHPRPRPNGRPPGRAPAPIYVLPAYVWPATPVPASGEIGRSVASAAAAPPIAPAPTARGTLHLDLQPAPAGQLFVDGVYVGTLDRLGTVLALTPGTRRLEIREPGYEPFVLTARIEADRDLVYRGGLTPRSLSAAAGPAPGSTPTAAPVTPAPLPARKVFYLIPGCYMGDVPPAEAGLSTACDLSRTITFRP